MNEDDDALPPPPSESFACHLAANKIAENVLNTAIQEFTDEQRAKDEQNLKNLKAQKENQSSLIQSYSKLKKTNVEEPSQVLSNVNDSTNEETKTFGFVRPLSGTTERISSFVYGYGGIAKESDGKVVNIPVINSSLIWSSERLRHLAGESPLLDNANKENHRQRASNSPQNLKINENTLYNLLNKNSQSTVINNVPISSYSSKPNSIKNNAKDATRIVPIQYSPVSIDSNTNFQDRGVLDTSPQQIFHSYEVRRRHHNSEHFPQPSSVFDSAPFYSGTFLLFINVI